MDSPIDDLFKQVELYTNDQVVEKQEVHQQQQTFTLNDLFNNSQILTMACEIDEETPCLDCIANECPGFKSHEWRCVCKHCKCPRECHDLRFKGYVTAGEKLGLDEYLLEKLNLNLSNKYSILEKGFTWQPSGLDLEEVLLFFENYPQDQIPRLGSHGEKWREKALIYQIPKQDVSIDYCRFLKTNESLDEYKNFIQTRNEHSLNIGICVINRDTHEYQSCETCHSPIEFDSVQVNAANSSWHPSCFCCFKCNEILVDLVYCLKDNHVYCLRHYAEELVPRCQACDELIFNSDYVHSMNQNYHTDHFNCWHCDSSLTGSRYILKDEHPYCIKCYEDLFAHSCEECQRKIGTDSKDLSYKDRHWHEKCFFCSTCKIPLVDKPFGSKNDALYCGECYNQAFASRCDKCTQIFKPGMKKMEYKGQQFHEQCFTCFSCNIAIGTKSFIPKDTKIFCVPCYEDNFATKCTRCIKVISQGGVTYKNQPFHRECFTCTNCQQSLAGQRFTSREDHPYCSDCFGKLFAKKCCACIKPITGIGGTKYISFEDRHWHNDCFTCNKCHSSLVGRGFLTEGLEIMCPECGRN